MKRNTTTVARTITSPPRTAAAQNASTDRVSVHNCRFSFPSAALSFYRTCRRSHRDFLVELKQSNAERHLNRLVTRVYRGHLYGRKPARKLRARRVAAWWGPQEWEVQLAGDPPKPVFLAPLSFFYKITRGIKGTAETLRRELFELERGVR